LRGIWTVEYLAESAFLVETGGWMLVFPHGRVVSRGNIIIVSSKVMVPLFCIKGFARAFKNE
jgi:hypothetical protein